MAYEINLKNLLESGKCCWEKSEDGKYYLLKDLVYCENPFEDAVYYTNPNGFGPYTPPPGTEPDGLYQTLWIYVPAEIFEGGTINGFDKKSAPVIFQNGCAGWRSSNPSGRPEVDFVKMGCVYVYCGARSRGAGKQAGTGRDLGKSPCAAVDLKAGVRYLRLNDEVIPGDKEKIISIGTSGGGQMSSILGASGDMPEYYPYLYEIGAAGIEKLGDEYVSTIKDSIFAAQCYCPITDIANADAAYAWMRYDAQDTGFRMGGPGARPGGHMAFDAPGGMRSEGRPGTPGGPGGLNAEAGMRGPGGSGGPGGPAGMTPPGGPGGPAGMMPPGGPGSDVPETPFSPFKLELQKDLAVKYCEYINSLNLRNQKGEELSFDIGPDGKPDPRSGSFYRQILSNISEALNIYIKDCTQPDGSFVELKKLRAKPGTEAQVERIPRKDAYEYIATLDDNEKWIRKNEDGTYEVTDLGWFIRGTHLKRNKDIPGFDTFHNRMESDAFGSEDIDKSHFSKIVADVLSENLEKYRALEGFADEDVEEYISGSNDPYVIKQTWMMASMRTLLKGESTPAKHWRTRNGSFDEHTSFSIAYTLAMAANAHPGVESVDYGLPWMQPHCSAEGTPSAGSFESWVLSICR